MPLHPVLHEGHPASLFGMSDDRLRRSGGIPKGAANLVWLVAINFRAGGAEGRELIPQRVQIRDFGRRTEALKAVRIDDVREIIEPALVCEDQGFPGGSLVPLAV
jgi:hypothetical protein